MKSQSQAVARLEKVVETFNAEAEKLTDQDRWPEGPVATVLMLYGVIITLAWLLDVEKELMSMIQMTRFAATLQEFEGKFQP